MAFIWNDKPNPPSADLPVPVPPGEITYEVNEVANTVNVGGAISYNTPNTGFDVVYELDSLNVRTMRVLVGNVANVNIRTALIETATMDHATINTANITNATINVGFFTGIATANYSMVSKSYVDNAIANISGGSGLDTTANLITTKGDLLVGFAPNTAHRFGAGSNGASLIVRNSSNLKVDWAVVSSSQQLTGLHIGTHHHPTLKLSQVLLRRADNLIMDDGESVSGWSNLTADITISGAGGLDANSSEAPNVWYEVWAIRNKTSGAKALLLHRMLERTLDQQWVAVGGTGTLLRGWHPATTNPFERYNTRISQSFVAGVTGPLRSIEVGMNRNLTPTGNVWLTIQDDNGIGNASGAVLATSRFLQAGALTLGGGTASYPRFVFETTVTVSAGHRYHWVAEGDFPEDVGGNCVILYGNTAPLGPGQQPWMANVGYTSGNLTINSGYGDARSYNVKTGRWTVAANTGSTFPVPQDLTFKTYVETQDTPFVYPSGYNQKVLVSYVRNNGSSNFKEYSQQNRTMVMGFDADWLAWSSGASQSTVTVDLSDTMPPIFCSVQFLCWTTNLFTGTTYGITLQDRYGTDLPLLPYFDLNYRGSYKYGPNQGKMGLSPVMALTDDQFLNSAQIGTNFFLYVANITF